jgi:hypothetical protein
VLTKIKKILRVKNMTMLIYIDYDYIHLHLLEKCIKEFIKWTQTKKNNIIII